MKLLFVNGHMNVGGVEKSLVDLLKSIDYKEHEVDLLLFEGFGDYMSQIPVEVNIISYNLGSTYGSVVKTIVQNLTKGDFRAVVLKIIFTLSSRLGVKYISLMRYLNITKKKYDCAIAYRIGICADYVGFAVDAKKKYMWWHHGEFDYPEHQVKRWRDTVLQMDKIVCVSEYAKELIKPHFPKKQEDMAVISNMILIDEIRIKSQQFDPYKDIDKTILVSVGRMSFEKHMINCVYAMEILKKRGYKDVCWFLIGDGVEKEKIEDLIREKELKNCVICAGSKENPYPYIANADIFVHPSYVESQGITVLEALALKKASIITKSHGVCEFIHHEENAILVDQGPEFLADAIADLLDNNEKKVKLEKITTCPEMFLQKNVVKKFFRTIEN